MRTVEYSNNYIVINVTAMPESYAHLFAKELVAKWLRDRAVTANVSGEEDHLLIALGPVKALVHSSVPTKGVFIEYPAMGKENGSNTLREPWEKEVPLVTTLHEKGVYPAFILDIAVQHFDTIKYGLEIVWRHPVPEEKIKRLQLAMIGCKFELYEIDAEWVLSQCKPPTYLKVRKLL